MCIYKHYLESENEPNILNTTVITNFYFEVIDLESIENDNNQTY